MNQISGKGRTKKFFQIVKSSKIYSKKSSVITLGDLISALRIAGGIRLSTDQIKQIRSSYGVKTANHDLSVEFDKQKHNVFDVHIDILETLLRANSTKEILDTYKNIVKTDSLERMDEVCVDFYGAMQTVNAHEHRM